MNMPDDRLIALYGTDNLNGQRQRYRDLVLEYSEYFGSPESPGWVSVPGRTELGGNHTDHNQGRVLCAAVRLDTIAFVTPRSDNRVRLKSSISPDLYELELSELNPKDDETGTTEALIRGVAAGLTGNGSRTGGFNAIVCSDVGIGSGLSSSASFEVLIGGIFNALYNGNSIDPVTLAKIGQNAENIYFGKPCGLMDQLACAVGGIMAIDFKDKENPVVSKIDADFSRTDYVLAVVDTGGSHADLTEAYASIPNEMKQVALLFGKETLRGVEEETFRADIARVRSETGDRAVLRALHFFSENRRVASMADALKNGDFDRYLQLVAESGASSNSMLQNIVSPGSAADDQPASLAIGVSNDFFRSCGGGVSRIHGGGFAGTIQVYVPKNQFETYSRFMETMFGDDCVKPLSIRARGISSLYQA